MSAIAKKIQLTAAVFAVTTTSVLAPVAVADPTDTDTGTSTSTSAESTSTSVGNAAGQAPTRSNRKDRPRASDGSDSVSSTPATATTPDHASTDVTAPTATAGSNATGSNPLFQNPLIWFGSPNPTPPPSTVIYNFEPLSNLPEFSRPMFGWLQGFNFEGCVLGLSNVVQGTVGPYGTATRSFSTSGCA